jgi:hypothetical protein
MKKFLAVFLCTGVLLSSVIALPANASSCLSKADRAATSRNNFDFLSMEMCYKSLGLSSTESKCSSIIGLASTLYNMDLTRDGFRKVMEYDSCRETISVQPKPIPKPSEISNNPRVPFVPVVPKLPVKVAPKISKCTGMPLASSVKLVYAKQDGSAQFRPQAPFYVGLDGYLNLRVSFNPNSKTAVTKWSAEVQTLDVNGIWIGWRHANSGTAGIQSLSTDHILNVAKGTRINPDAVKGVRVRVQLSNNCGKTKWIEITKSEGVSLWDPSRGTPISIDCLPGPNEDGPSYSILGLSRECVNYGRNPVPQ